MVDIVLNYSKSNQNKPVDLPSLLKQTEEVISKELNRHERQFIVQSN
jgi:hypothetical protein